MLLKVTIILLITSDSALWLCVYALALYQSFYSLNLTVHPPYSYEINHVHSPYSFEVNQYTLFTHSCIFSYSCYYVPLQVATQLFCP